MTSMEPTSKKEEAAAAAARAPAPTLTPRPEENRPKRKTGEETTGFSSFPRRVLETPHGKNMGHITFERTIANPWRRKTAALDTRKNGQGIYTQENSELSSSSGSAEQEPATQDPGRRPNATTRDHRRCRMRNQRDSDRTERSASSRQLRPDTAPIQTLTNAMQKLHDGKNRMPSQLRGARKRRKPGTS